MLLAWFGLAAAQPPHPGSVLQPLTDDVTIDWTALRVDIRAGARVQTVGSLRSVEDLARRNVERALERALPEVALTATTKLGDVLVDPHLGKPIAARRARWRVVEAQYATSGTITLTATVSLASISKPWVLANAVGDVPPEEELPFSGVLVDARAIDVTMAVAPRIITEGGLVVFDGGLDAFSAVTRSPVRYVASPDHPLAASVGDRPWRLLATGTSSGVDLVVAEVEAAAVAKAGPVIRRGEIVVVVAHRD